MRQLPSESIDLIYIDPPFFSGKTYNVIFGDQNELRSFSDIWEGGMPGYLVWLNARLYEMKRLLRRTGSLLVHCDWHASHYIKVELDKIFGYGSLINELIWYYTGAAVKKDRFGRRHDCILWYARGKTWTFNVDEVRGDYAPATKERFSHYIGNVRSGGDFGQQELNPKGKHPDDVVSISIIAPSARERIGYPTQKPEKLVETLIKAASNGGDTVGDFFSGGGTTAAVAQRLGRSWITSDQSRVAVAITADRLTRQVEEETGKLFEVPDFTVEHWGVYETKRLAEAPPEQFRAFVLRCFGAVPEEREEGLHGYKGAIPVWVGKPDQRSAVTAANVQEFAKSIGKSLRYKQDNLRDGIMLGWAFGPDAIEAADRLRRLEQTELNFIRLDMIRIDSAEFRQHISSLKTSNADYGNFLTFVQPPRVEVGYKRISLLNYIFDVSETVVMNSGAKIINVQWDFDYDEHFSSTPGFSFSRTSKKEVALKAQYEFAHHGKFKVACKVQDDLGGEGIWSDVLEVK